MQKDEPPLIGGGMKVLLPGVKVQLSGVEVQLPGVEVLAGEKVPLLGV